MPRCHLYTGQVFKKSTEVKSLTVGLSKDENERQVSRDGRRLAAVTVIG